MLAKGLYQLTISILNRMGRHRIYNTDEEKREANRAKSKRHHDKYLCCIIFTLFRFSRMLQSKGDCQ